MGATGPMSLLQELTPLLLEASNDPERFVAAHVALARLFRENRRDLGGDLERRADGSFGYVFDGLTATLRPVGEADEGTTYEGIAAFQPCAATVDPGQLPTLRDRWRQRLRQ